MPRILALALALCLPFESFAQEKTAKPAVAEPYIGFNDDQALLRKQLVWQKPGEKPVKASSAEACAAAHRIFSRVPLLFKSREEVLEILGNPATISDYNQPAGKERGSPLIDVFDTGLGGWKYTIGFDRISPDKVVEMKAEPLN